MSATDELTELRAACQGLLRSLESLRTIDWHLGCGTVAGAWRQFQADYDLVERLLNKEGDMGGEAEWAPWLAAWKRWLAARDALLARACEHVAHGSDRTWAAQREAVAEYCRAVDAYMKTKRPSGVPPSGVGKDAAVDAAALASLLVLVDACLVMSDPTQARANIEAERERITRWT